MGQGPHFVFCGHTIWQDMEACKKLCGFQRAQPFGGVRGRAPAELFHWIKSDLRTHDWGAFITPIYQLIHAGVCRYVNLRKMASMI